MSLPQQTPEAIEAAGDSFLTPFPPRRVAPVGSLALLKMYRRNTIEIFSAHDYTKDLIKSRFLKMNIFTVNDPTLVQETFQRKHEVFQRKTPQMRHALAPLLGDGLFVSDGPVWRARRAAVTPILHVSRVRELAPLMTDTIAEWRAQWAALPDGAEIDVLSEMAELTAEIISRTAFGHRLGRSFTAELVKGFSAYQAHVDQLDLPSVLGLPDWVPRPQGLAARRALRRVHAVIDEVIDSVLSGDDGEGGENAVVAQLLEARDADGRPLSREAVRNEAIVIFMAGHETTANTLAWAWFLISQSPRVAARLREELAEVLDGQPAAFDDVKKLVYARAVIEETLRLYPPVPILGRQALADDRIGDAAVPKGSLVLVAPFMLHRKPSLWPMPDHFVPERFDPRRAPRPDKYAYVPFAIGPRICPGLAFGLTEAVLCLATLAQAFELTLAPGHEVRAQCRLTLRPGARLPMRVSARR